MSSPAQTAKILAIALIVGIGAGLLVYSLGSGGPARPSEELSPNLLYDMESLRRVDPNLICYRQVASWPLPQGASPRALSIAPSGLLYVSSEAVLFRLDPANGQVLGQWTLPARIEALDVAPDGAVLLAARSGVYLMDEPNSPSAQAREIYRADGDAWITSIAATDSDAYVADAGNKVVWRMDRDGRPMGQIGREGHPSKTPALHVPSAHLDVAIHPDGLIRVTNPGHRRVEAYTPDGYRRSVWGTTSMVDIAGFAGCCNPTDIAITPEGDYVTAEKGVPRLKLYRADGTFDCVIAAPSDFAEDVTGLDVDVDARGRVLVVDPAAKSIRVFARKTTND